MSTREYSNIKRRRHVKSLQPKPLSPVDVAEDRPIRVLIVDDDPEDVHLTAIALRRAGPPGYQLEQAETLDDAFDMLKSKRFDIVLLDLGLSSSQGLETLDQFRATDASIPVVVLSGLDDDKVAIQSLEHNAQDYLSKLDVNARNLSRAIRHAIQRQNCVSEISRLLEKVRESEEVLRRKNDRLKQLYETAHTIVDNVSHEFRTPLTVIKEYVSLVRDATVGPVTDEQREFLTIAEDRADDLNTMIDDMLDVSKLEGGLLAINRRTHRLDEIIQRLTPSLMRKASIRNIHLATELDDSIAEVFCDSQKVERVLVNLVLNALKFTKPDGNVTIWAQEKGIDVVVGVTDTGDGISEDRLKSIFERFQQVDASPRECPTGFGLGLSIAKELVELNLGRMSVESKPDAGTTFSFTLPKADPVDVTQRYLTMLQQARNEFVAILFAEIDSCANDDDTDDIDAFLSQLVRVNDLAFRLSRNRWMLLLPEPRSEVELFFQRAEREFLAANRNRPRTTMPKIRWSIDGSWSDLRITREEILGRVSSLTRATTTASIRRDTTD